MPVSFDHIRINIANSYNELLESINVEAFDSSNDIDDEELITLGRENLSDKLDDLRLNILVLLALYETNVGIQSLIDTVQLVKPNLDWYAGHTDETDTKS